MAPAPPVARPGILLVAHGSTRSGASAEPVLDLARALRARGFPEVRTAFWKEEPFLHQALETTRASIVVVLPVFLAEGYFSRAVVPRELGLEYGWNRVGGRAVRLLPPLGTLPEMADLVAARAREAAPPGTPLASALLVVMGHGTARDPGSAGAVMTVCARLSATGEFGRVAPAFIDQDPRVVDALAAAREPLVLLVPFLVAAGWHGGTTVPRELGLEGRRTQVVYTEPVGTHPALIDAIEVALRDAVADGTAPGAGELAAAETPLARLEGELTSRLEACATLTMLEVHVRAADSVYELRHVIEADAGAETLSERADRDALERLARKTADGRHRPLRTGADLAPGWRHVAPTARALVEALLTLCGPAVVHWSLGERGALEPSTFRAVAARQSGMYARLARIDVASIEAGIRRTCEGLPCLRARLWTPAGVVPPAATETPRDRLVVPCPAPCPVLLTSVLELLGEAERDDDAE
jgi:sirohydrochlorin cobaltochelatase